VLYATVMPGRSHEGSLPPLGAEEVALAGALAAHVQKLAGTIGERRAGAGNGLEQAAHYLAQRLAETEAAGHGRVSRESLGPAGLHAENLIWELPGRTPELVIVGAHYDSAHSTPGANDNASGVAAALELVPRLAKRRFAKTVRVVLFANEEMPYFQGLGMGSALHARGCRARGEPVLAMLALESLGYYSEAPGSQRYPSPVDLLYPSRGNFIGFVGNLSSRALVRRAVGAFRARAPFPSEGAALPELLPGVGWSDHSSFWREGYPAVMVTDTAVFRDPHYHQPTDTPEHLDYERMARVVLGLLDVVSALAGNTAT
jgi:hypothetical protein